MKVIIINLKYSIRGQVVVSNGEFYLRGRTPEDVAVEWIRKLQRELEVTGVISVMVNEKEDITNKVMALIKASLDE